MSEKQITITVSGSAGTGKTSMIWLLGDFLDHTGFKVNIESDDLNVDDEVLSSVISRIPDSLQTMMEKNTKILIKEV